MDNYGGWFTYEHPLWQLHRPGRAPGVVRHYSGVFYFVDVIRAPPDSRMAEHDPHKTGVERRGVARLGASWDSRDNDWDPSEGSLVELTFDLAGHYTASVNRADANNFLYILNQIDVTAKEDNPEEVVSHDSVHWPKLAW